MAPAEAEFGDIHQPHAFVSYVEEDLALVDRLCADLRESQVAIWRDRDSLRPGDNWKVQIRRAIEQGAHFLACFSQNTSRRTKSYMYEELSLAIEELRKHAPYRRWFIPIRLDDAPIPDISIGPSDTLRSLQWVALSPDWNAGFTRLLETLRAADPSEPFVDREVARRRVADLRLAIEASEKQKREFAIYQLRTIARYSPEAQDILLQALLREKDHDLLDRIGGALSSVGAPIVEPLCDLVRRHVINPRARVPVRAISVLARLGPTAKAAVPLLVAELRLQPAGTGTCPAATALAQVGGQAVPMLLEVAADPDETVRARAFGALGQIGDDKARAVVPTLLSAINDIRGYQGEEVGQAAASALAQLQGEPELAVPALAAALQRSVYSTPSIIRALGEYGELASGAVSALMKELVDGAHRIRGEGYPYDPSDDAAKALGLIGRAAIGPLIEALHHNDTRVRRLAAKALGIIGPPAAAAVPVLAEVSDRSSEFVVALGQIGVSSPQVISTLRTQLRLAHGDHSAALKAAAMLGRGAEDLIPDVLRHIGDESYNCGPLAVVFLREIGEPAVAPLAELITRRCLRGGRGGRGHDCWNAVKALASLSTTVASARPLIESLSTHSEHEVRGSVAQGLQTKNGATLNQWRLRLLSQLADDESGRVRDWATSALEG